MVQGQFLVTLSRLLLSLCLGAAPLASLAADNFTAVSDAGNTATSGKPAKPAKTKKAKSPKPPVSPSSGENKSERDKRLLRECRGKTNAGACEGYAS